MKKTRLKKSCQVCAREFEIKVSHAARGFGKFCSRKCCGLSRRGNWAWWLKGKPSWVKGKKWSEEVRRKNSEAHRGEKSYLWKGGVSNPNKLLRESLDYKIWRAAVFQRDEYTCQDCGDKTGGNLQADHIKPFALFPESRFDLSNGRTLCITCHKKTPSYLNPHMKRYQFESEKI